MVISGGGSVSTQHSVAAQNVAAVKHASSSGAGAGGTSPAQDRAKNIVPVIEQIQSHGVTSANGIAIALNKLRIPPIQTGASHWSAVQVLDVMRGSR